MYLQCIAGKLGAVEKRNCGNQNAIADRTDGLQRAVVLLNDHRYVVAHRVNDCVVGMVCLGEREVGKRKLFFKTGAKSYLNLIIQN